MIHSMTGFGAGRAEREGAAAAVELRSVNKRFLEISARLPGALAAREADVQALLKKHFTRGRITVQVQVEQETNHALPIQVDPEAARAYGQLLERLRKAAGLRAPIRVADLLSFSDVFTTPEADEEEAGEETWEAVQAALLEAVGALQAMRRQEGRTLRRDLEARLDGIEEALGAVERRAPERLAEARRRLAERLDELMSDERLATDRLEAEIALLADKLDVTEECVRLRSHLEQFRAALASDEPAGRKLQFLIQEIHREVNTIGAKANDAAIAHRAVRMKEEIEKIREQVQNVE